MSIILKREAKDYLEAKKDSIDFLLIDGTLVRDDEKICGCCGPPPSPDYKIQVFRKQDGSPRKLSERTVDIDKIVKFKVSKQLHDAIVAARMSIVIFYLETTNETVSPSMLVAKII
nr:hypothetical protein [Candidatus Sigynarchaeota archaeon]